MLTRSKSEQAPSPNELSALLRLLDDETPEVREQVTRQLDRYHGDLSEALSTHPHPLNERENRILRKILHRARCRNLEQDWLAPSGGAGALQEDWETFESLLRTLSDFLHDGITCRQPLPDAIDLLAEEAEEAAVLNAGQLRVFLFEGGLLRGNQDAYDDPRNSDLAWSISEGKSNPIGLCVIYTLVARRLNLVVEPVGFPGHFMCRIHEDGQPLIVDCFHRGQVHLQSDLASKPDLSRVARRALEATADPGSILARMLNNLHAAFVKYSKEPDASLIHRLKKTLH